MTGSLERILKPVLDSPNGEVRRPVVDSHFESNIPGLHVIGDLSGAPVVKLAMEHGFDVAAYIASRPDARGSKFSYDVLVIGAGAAGLNAALALKDHGLRVIVIEKNKIANTIEDFPEAKWVYAEPDAVPPKGKLWLDGATKEDLLARWHEIVNANALDVRTAEAVTAVERLRESGFRVRSSKGEYSARRVILATGQRGNPRWLGVAGEEQEHVYHRLYSPKHYSGEDIVVVGGGNSAVEAAVALAERNRVTLSYRGAAFGRVFRDNDRKLREAVAAGRITLLLESRVESFGKDTCTLTAGGVRRTLPCQHAFVLIGAELPEGFLRSLGLRLENDWTGNLAASAGLTAAVLSGLWVLGGKTGVAALAGYQAAGAAVALAALAGLVWTALRGSRFSWLGIAFLISYSIYGIKQTENFEFWPYRGWGAKMLSFFGRPWSFWYTVLYTSVMTVFGVHAMKRWGLDKKDKFQIWRYTSLIGFQWLFFFLIPEFLFRWAVEYQWVGAQLAADPAFAQNAWRSYGIVYAWPLFFYTFLNNPHQIWVAWGVLLSFGILPVLVLFHGKRYCSWICGCGGLAETLGDRWRHLAPKGNSAIRWEAMNRLVLGGAAVVTLALLAADAVAIVRAPAAKGLEWYHLIADTWLVGILPVSLYPFFGGKVWCRYWCPLAKLMELYSKAFTRLRWSRFAIHANDKCIACGECTRYCQVGIDVMRFATMQKELNNANSSCIGCGICVTVCPMDVLSFTAQSGSATTLVQIASKSI